MSISPALRGPAKGSAVSERRRHPRRNVMDRRLVTVNLDNKDVGLLVDISESGLAVQALARIKPGATTALQFELPETTSRIEAAGCVAWADATTGRAGIQFEDLPEESLTKLRAWLERRDEPVKPATATLPAPSVLSPQSKVAEIAALQREIVAAGLDREQALAHIAERTAALTHADGTAIVLGDARLMTCKASSGSAPPVEAELRPDSGLSGECVRTGVTIRCEDTELDPRVDPEVCRQIGLRSAVIVPLFARGNISGLVEVFYAAPHAFDGRDVLTLRRVADLISATMGQPASSQTVATEAPEIREAPLDVPRAPDSQATSAASASVRPPMLVCDLCGHRNPPGTVDCERCDVPLPGSVRQTGYNAAEAAVVPAKLPPAVLAAEFQPATVDDADLRTDGRVTTPRLLIALAVLLLLAGVLFWREFRRRQPMSQAQAAPNAEPPAVQAAAPAPLADPVSLPTTAPAASKPPAATTLASRIGVAGRPPTHSTDAVAKNMAEPDVTVNYARPVDSTTRIQPGPVADVPAPSVSMPAVNSMAAILSPPAIAPTLTAVPRTASISPPRLIRRVEPIYPKIAISNRVQGVVVLQATILHTGKVVKIRVLSGNGLLAGAALSAVQQWRYKPQQLDGKAVDVDTTITLNFSLGKNGR